MSVSPENGHTHTHPAACSRNRLGGVIATQGKAIGVQRKPDWTLGALALDAPELTPPASKVLTFKSPPGPILGPKYTFDSGFKGVLRSQIDARNAPIIPYTPILHFPLRIIVPAPLLGPKYTFESGFKEVLRSHFLTKKIVRAHAPTRKTVHARTHAV